MCIVIAVHYCRCGEDRIHTLASGMQLKIIAWQIAGIADGDTVLMSMSGLNTVEEMKWKYLVQKQLPTTTGVFVYFPNGHYQKRGRLMDMCQVYRSCQEFTQSDVMTLHFEGRKRAPIGDTAVVEAKQEFDKFCSRMEQLGFTTTSAHFDKERISIALEQQKDTESDEEIFEGSDGPETLLCNDSSDGTTFDVLEDVETLQALLATDAFEWGKTIELFVKILDLPTLLLSMSPNDRVGDMVQCAFEHAGLPYQVADRFWISFRTGLLRDMNATLEKSLIFDYSTIYFNGRLGGGGKRVFRLAELDV